MDTLQLARRAHGRATGVVDDVQQCKCGDVARRRAKSQNRSLPLYLLYLPRQPQFKLEVFVFAVWLATDTVLHCKYFVSTVVTACFACSCRFAMNGMFGAEPSEQMKQHFTSVDGEKDVLGACVLDLILKLLQVHHSLSVVDLGNALQQVRQRCNCCHMTVWRQRQPLLCCSAQLTRNDRLPLLVKQRYGGLRQFILDQRGVLEVNNPVRARFIVSHFFLHDGNNRDRSSCRVA